MTPLVRSLREHLLACMQQEWTAYSVPGQWVGADGVVTFPSAPAYFLHQLDILDGMMEHKPRRVWAGDDVAYNALVRHVTSFDHFRADEGRAREPRGWKTTGTFLKLMALLPYLRSMGVGTLSLLPITDIGRVGKKGTLGSPYAVRNPFRLDDNLAEHVIPMSVEDQCRVLIEIAHLLGMKVVLEVVLRTASVDSDLIVQRPDWFYWIDEERVLRTGMPFSAPSFSDEDIQLMTSKTERHDLARLPEPPEEYRQMFTAPPWRILADDRGWKGIGPRAITLRIPGAFADWPVNDPQPAWSDVTYYRLHDHQQYRYMAYNTIRMYEKSLDQPQYRQTALWNTIANCIPHFIRTLNIDGALIDMGHALPADLRHQVIREARMLRPDFLLFEETFDISSRSANQGYYGVVGYLPFEAHLPALLKNFVHKLSLEPSPVHFFAAPESHNTPRAAGRPGGAQYSACVWTVLRCLPRGIPFMVEGFDCGETRPINTGLRFTTEDLQRWKESDLALFSDVPLEWNRHVPIHQQVIGLERKLKESSWWQVRSDDDSVTLLDTPESIVAYVRRSATERRGIMVIANMSDTAGDADIRLPAGLGVISLEASDIATLTTDGAVLLALKPWQWVVLFTLHGSRHRIQRPG